MDGAFVYDGHWSFTEIGLVAMMTIVVLSMLLSIADR